MPRQVTIDNVQVRRLGLVRETGGGVSVFCEYAVHAGTQVVQTKGVDITAQLSPGRRAALQALFEAVGQEIAATELS